MIRTLIATALLLAAASCAYGGGSMKGKKLIEYGWDVPTTEAVRKNIAKMEEIPFDGIVMYVSYKTGDKDNLAMLPWQTFSRTRFKPEQYEHAIADIKATKFKRFKDNFIGLIAMPGDVDWFDDEWSSVAFNAGCLAKVAKQSGCKGIMFDPEHYGKYPIWAYTQFDPKNQAAHTFEEYYAKIKERGKEFMRAIDAEYPGIVILTLYGPCLPYIQAPKGDLKLADYGLLMAFYDGMIEVASPKTTIIDGFECSYGYRTPEPFDEGRKIVMERAKAMSTSQKDYDKHIRMGYGIWADNGGAPQGWHPDDFTKNYYSPEGLRASLAYALERSDGYVWVYSERLRWWGDRNAPQPYIDALALAKKGPGEKKNP